VAVPGQLITVYGFPIKGGLEVRFENTKFHNCDENIDKNGNVLPRGRVDWMNGYHSNILLDIDGTDGQFDFSFNRLNGSGRNLFSGKLNLRGRQVILCELFPHT